MVPEKLSEKLSNFLYVGLSKTRVFDTDPISAGGFSITDMLCVGSMFGGLATLLLLGATRKNGRAKAEEAHERAMETERILQQVKGQQNEQRQRQAADAVSRSDVKVTTGNVNQNVVIHVHYPGDQKQ